jgi:hypothetical protein
MSKISPFDASTLSYLARHTGIPSEQRARVSSSLKGEALKVARALEPKNASKKSSERGAVVRTARGLRTWAVENDKIASVMVKRKR